MRTLGTSAVVSPGAVPPILRGDLEAIRYCNDDPGAPAYDPAILLKIILYAYSRGITSSRKIEQCCKENIIFMALSCDTSPTSPLLPISLRLSILRS